MVKDNFFTSSQKRTPDDMYAAADKITPGQLAGSFVSRADGSPDVRVGFEPAAPGSDIA